MATNSSFWRKPESSLLCLGIRLAEEPQQRRPTGFGRLNGAGSHYIWILASARMTRGAWVSMKKEPAVCKGIFEESQNPGCIDDDTGVGERGLAGWRNPLRPVGSRPVRSQAADRSDLLLDVSAELAQRLGKTGERLFSRAPKLGGQVPGVAPDPAFQQSLIAAIEAEGQVEVQQAEAGQEIGRGHEWPRPFRWRFRPTVSGRSACF